MLIHLDHLNVNLKDIEISDFIIKNIDLTPFDIENRLKLRKPIYLKHHLMVTWEKI